MEYWGVALGCSTRGPEEGLGVEHPCKLDVGQKLGVEQIKDDDVELHRSGAAAVLPEVAWWVGSGGLH